MKNKKNMKLAIVMSHPIQYQAPFLKKIHTGGKIELMTYFLWNFGVKEIFDNQFKQKIKWDIPVLDGYKYKFVKNFSLKPSSDFWGTLNFGIIGELYKNHYDAVLVYGWNYFANWLVFAAALFKRIPVFLFGESPLNQELLKPKWKIQLKKFFLKPIFNLTAAIFYIGEENKKFYEYYGVSGDKLFFAPYAIDNERLQRSAEKLIIKRDKLRKEFGIKKEDVVILFVGKLINKKRPMDLLKAHKIFIDNNRQMEDIVHLVYVGSGDYEEKLKKYSELNNFKNINFLGFKNQAELPKYYAMADIFVLPSGVGETWGLVVNEAMNFSLPVIVSDMVGCGSDLVNHGENGFKFNNGDIKGLSQKLDILIKNKNKRKKFGEESFKIIQFYNYDEDIKAILMALEKIKN